MTGLRNDDFRPFIWKTTDFGQTWTSIAGNLPQDAINVVRESPRNADVLFVGTDTGVFVTIDGGKAWTRLKGAPLQAAGGGGRGGGGGAAGATARPRGVLPTVPVHDLKIHPRDRELIAGTHGRGIWIADISEIEELTPAVRERRCAPVRDRSGHCLGGRAARQPAAATNFSGVSRPTDMGISYFLKSDVTRRREGSRLQRIARHCRDGWREDGGREHGALEPAGPARANRRRGGGRCGTGGRGGGGGAGGGRGAGAGADAGAAAGFATSRRRPAPIAWCCQWAAASTRNSRRSFRIPDAKRPQTIHHVGLRSIHLLA